MKSILLDVDGVVADFVAGVESIIGRKFTQEEKRKWDVLQFLKPEEREEVYAELAQPDFWRNLPVVDGALEGVRYLDRLGYDITWVTAPWASCESWESARRDWLDEKFAMSAKGHHYIPTASKEKVVGDILIDDKPQNIREWKEANPDKKAFLFDTPFNQDYDGAPRFTWSKVREVL